MYTDKDLEKLMAEVSTQFTAHLAKAEDESKEKDESAEKPEHEKEEDKGVEDQHQEDTSKEDKGEQPESKEERIEADKEENSKPIDDAHGDAEDHGYDDEDMQHMHSMYASMSKAELRAHHDAVRKCMDGHGLAKCEDGMMKSEKDVVVAVESEEVSLLKSELEAVKAQSAEKEKNLDAVSAFLTKFVEKTAPAGKAITSLDIIAKSGSASEEKPLTKNEIHEKLLAKSKDLSLAKSDRDAINSYYFSKNIETVRHLLK